MSDSGRLPANPPTGVTQNALTAILAKHGLQGKSVVPLRSSSAGNSVYMVGDDLVLRVPHSHPRGIEALKTTCIAVPAAQSAGVRTPRIVVFDDDRDILPVPYLIMERVHGESLSKQDLSQRDTSSVWHTLGHELALLHTGVTREGPPAQLEFGSVDDDPRPWLENLVSEGLMLPGEAAWLLRWLDELQPLAFATLQRAFCHGDVNGDNILVNPETLEYMALVDWDGAGWLDPAWDFVPVPLAAVPSILEGYREVAPMIDDHTAEARILWHHLQYTVFIWRKGKPPGRAGVEQGLLRLNAGIAAVLELPGARWMENLV